MQQPHPLQSRPLQTLLWAVVGKRQEGAVVIRDRDGQRHRVWLHGGYVIGVAVRGRVDPLLHRLRQEGALDRVSYHDCITSMERGSGRCGQIAVQHGVPRTRIRDALKQQTRDRMAALVALCETRGHDAWFEPGPAAGDETSIRMPLGAVLPGFREQRAPSAARAADPHGPDPDLAVKKQNARRRLRQLARRLHPDLNGHLEPSQREALARDLAVATANYHRL